MSFESRWFRSRPKKGYPIGHMLLPREGVSPELHKMENERDEALWQRNLLQSRLDEKTASLTLVGMWADTKGSWVTASMLLGAGILQFGMLVGDAMNARRRR